LICSYLDALALFGERCGSSGAFNDQVEQRTDTTHRPSLAHLGDVYSKLEKPRPEDGNITRSDIDRGIRITFATSGKATSASPPCRLPI
jgi:hypothetical protein